MPKRDGPSPKPGFSIKPKGASGCVVVLHEVWGSDGHIEDVCKRLGKLGFAATASNLYRGYEDLLTPNNVNKAMRAVWDLSLAERRDEAKVAETLARKRADQTVKDTVALLYDQAFRDELLARVLLSISDAHSSFGRVSALGFSFGGGLALKAAAKSDRLSSVVSYCAEPLLGEDVKRISSPMLTIYASNDEIINPKVPAFVEAAFSEGRDLTLKIYPDTRHDFFNYTRKDVYDRGAARDAWSLTSEFLKSTLGRRLTGNPSKKL